MGILDLVQANRGMLVITHCNKHSVNHFIICVAFLTLPLSSALMTSLGYGILYGIFSLLCVLLQRAGIRSDSLTKGHAKRVRQHRGGLPPYLKASQELSEQTVNYPRFLLFHFGHKMMLIVLHSSVYVL